MAKRRMLLVSLVESDEFYELSTLTQLLYIHLNLNADDDGLVDKVKSIMRSTGASSKNYRSLIEGGYIIELSKNVVAITHWHQHNRIKRDRYTKTTYDKLIKELSLDENDRYFKASEVIFGDKCAPQDSIGKDSIGQESIGKVSEDKGSIAKESESINTHSFIHTNGKSHEFSTSEGCADQLTRADVDHKLFLAKLKLYCMIKYKGVEFIDFIEYYDRNGWVGHNGESVKDNFQYYIDQWYDGNKKGVPEGTP